MKKSTSFILCGLLLLSLSSCNFFNGNTSSSEESSINSIDSSIFDSDTSSSSSIISSSSNNQTTSEVKTIDFYAINDFHGRISSRSDEDAPGISKLSTYLKTKKEENPNGYVFVSTGDTWQDTYESGYNKGALISKCLEEMECEAMSLGNHDFDWGIDVIKTNQELSPNCTYLSANVYNFPNENEFAFVGKEYKIIERDDVRIGIIGTIGSTQNTSITSSIWENLSFKRTTPIVQSLSDKLRLENNCDVIMWLNHADYDDSDSENVTAISPISNKRYVDAVFNGHSHQRETYLRNGVPFVQAGSHGVNVSHISLSLDKNKNVIDIDYGYEGYGQISRCQEDPSINQIISEYFTSEYLAKKDSKVGTLSSNKGYVDKYYAGSLLAKATYDMYEEEMKDVDIVMNNGSRSSISSGQVTIENIFNLLPFTNYTYVCKGIKGKDILNEMNYLYYYLPDSSLEILDDQEYTIACIDYNLLHKNKDRNYDYFPSFKKENVQYIIEDYSCDIVANYLNIKKAISESEFYGPNYKSLYY
ncbi:MAG: metallophosphoesterase [Bacilli bacterium]|nr:metallophosphoesterase [Bacillales bacterium]MDY2575216.1 metallophosphoesterase [Bacilli bacterium]